MCICDTCKIEASIRSSDEPGCCAWYLENVVVCGISVDLCPVYKPVDTLQKVGSKICPNLSGYILRWINSEQFIASIVNRNGKRGEMICHIDFWNVF